MKSNRSRKLVVAVAVSTRAPEAPSPVVRHLLDGVVRQAARGDRAALATVTRELRARMVAHAEEHLARFDMDAEDVVQDVLLALLDRALPAPRREACAVEWLMGQVALFAQPDLVA
jgi:hypothetical protein